MPLAGFEPAIPAGERRLSHALNRAVTGTGMLLLYLLLIPRFVASSLLLSIPSISKRLCTLRPPILYRPLSFTSRLLSALYCTGLKVTPAESPASHVSSSLTRFCRLFNAFIVSYQLMHVLAVCIACCFVIGCRAVASARKLTGIQQ